MLIVRFTFVAGLSSPLGGDTLGGQCIWTGNMVLFRMLEQPEDPR
jgi:hypothetical protein